MITTIFLNIIYAFVSFFINLLPLGTGFPASWIAGIYSIWGYINAFSFIVPVDILVFALSIAISFHLFIFGWNILHWVYGLIRGTKMH